MSLKVITCYALECDWCGRRIPDRESEFVGWDTVDGIIAVPQNQYERWGVTGDGRLCCTDCLTATGDDRYVTPDGTAATLLNGIHITERT